MPHAKDDGFTPGGAEEQAKADLRRVSETSLAPKTEVEIEMTHPTSRTRDEGMRPIENKDQAPSGALDHGGHEVARRRSHGARP